MAIRFRREPQRLGRQQLLFRALLHRLEEAHDDIGTARRLFYLAHVVLDEAIDRQRGRMGPSASLLDEAAVDLD